VPPPSPATASWPPALSRTPPQAQLLLLVAAVVLVAVAGVTALEAARDLHALLAAARAAGAS